MQNCFYFRILLRPPLPWSAPPPRRIFTLLIGNCLLTLSYPPPPPLQVPVLESSFARPCFLISASSSVLPRP